MLLNKGWKIFLIKSDSQIKKFLYILREEIIPLCLSSVWCFALIETTHSFFRRLLASKNKSKRLKIKDNWQYWILWMKSSILSIFVFSWSDTLFGIQEARNVNEYLRNWRYHNDNTRHKTKLQKEIYFKSIGEHLHLNKVINRCLAKEKIHGMKFFVQIF